MNRDLRFRVFNPIEKKMIFVGIFNGLAHAIFTESFDFESMKVQGIILNIHVSEVMQYTGLKDKNETPIYEGDIVKTYWQHCGITNYDYDVIGVVIFSKDTLSFSIKTMMPNEWEYPFCNFEREEINESHTEVIGNIYQNTELLESLE
jgi:uncharacterized phage protein (TIGR01671 family)